MAGLLLAISTYLCAREGEEHMTNEEILEQWITANISKRKTKNTSRSSYGLKHSAERALGFYISNYELVEVMLKLGYTASKIKSSPNYIFNASYTALTTKEKIR